MLFGFYALMSKTILFQAGQFGILLKAFRGPLLIVLLHFGLTFLLYVERLVRSSVRPSAGAAALTAGVFV